MGIKRVKVKFQYFKVVGIEANTGADIPYNLNKWINKVGTMDLEDRKKDIFTISGRLEDIKTIKEKYLAFQFIRMEPYSDTYTMSEKEKAKHVDLEDDEYIGKNTVALYDPLKSILMIQVNRGGFSPSSIEKYINGFETIQKDDTVNGLCYLRPIIKELNIENKKSNLFKKLEVRFSDVRQVKVENSKDMQGIIDTCNSYEAVTAHIELGLGYSDVNSLNNDTISSTVKDIKNNKNYISSAKLTIKESDKSVIYDLFDNIDHDYRNFTIQERGELGFEYVANEMADAYEKSSSRHQN